MNSELAHWLFDQLQPGSFWPEKGVQADFKSQELCFRLPGYDRPLMLRFQPEEGDTLERVLERELHVMKGALVEWLIEHRLEAVTALFEASREIHGNS